LIFSKSYVPTAFLLLLRRGKSRPSRQRRVRDCSGNPFAAAMQWRLQKIAAQSPAAPTTPINE